MVDIAADRLGTDGDLFYAELLAAQEGLSPEASARLTARLLLILANQVGDLAVLRAAIVRASEGIRA
jgi:hypothetical protein